MRIGEPADRTGVPTKTIRFYEGRGLLLAGRTESGLASQVVKGVAVALVVLVVLLTGLPVIVAGHSMPACPSCDEGVPVWPMCFAILPAAALFLALVSRRLRALASVRPSLLCAVVPHPPPRFG